mgnify:CR=1 FL=1
MLRCALFVLKYAAMHTPASSSMLAGRSHKGWYCDYNAHKPSSQAHCTLAASTPAAAMQPQQIQQTTLCCYRGCHHT